MCHENSYLKLTIVTAYEILPSADGSEEPVSEFLFERFLHCVLQNHTSTMTIAENASIPTAPPTIAAFDFDMSKGLCVSHKKS